MTAQILRFADYDRRSREPDAACPRDPADATIIILNPGPATVFVDPYVIAVGAWPRTPPITLNGVPLIFNQPYPSR